MKFTNKEAYREYQISEKKEAGLILSGAEVKAVRTRGIQLKDAVVKIKNGEAFLINAVIEPYKFMAPQGYNPSQMRKLLLKKREIADLQHKINQKLTLLPLVCYNIGRWIKLEIGIGKRKKQFEKRREILEKETKRKIEKHLKERSKNF